jgi:predicted enzyme related to lactoylglutathione lyase
MTDGKICYLEIPATDVAASVRFYTKVFGWKVRTRDDGQQAFDDTAGAGAVSGAWITGRPPSRDPGILTYLMVDSIEQTARKITAAGGTIATPATALHQPGEAYATFRDPAGNLLGLYQPGK